MASKRALRRRSCKIKHRYADEDAAKAAAAGARRRAGGWIIAYPCPFCGGWHIGHPSAKKRRAIKAKQSRK